MKAFGLPIDSAGILSPTTAATDHETSDFHEILTQTNAPDNLGRIDVVSVRPYMWRNDILWSYAYRRPQER
jgi:hypothetical protein